MRQLLAILCSAPLLAPLCGCQLTGMSASSDSNTPTPAVGLKFAPLNEDSEHVARDSADSLDAEPISRNQKRAGKSVDDHAALTQKGKRSSRTPVVKPAVHAGDPDPAIPAGEAGDAAATPSGNFLSRILTGKKPSAKRIPLPLSDGPAAQATNDEAFDGFESR